MTKHADGVAAAFGYLRPAEVDEIARAARKACENSQDTPPVFVNIGAGAGTSALALRESCLNAALTTVDISPGGPLGGLEGERNAFTNAGFPAERFPRQILADSKVLGHDWRTPIDVLFVDGDHTREGVRGDIDAWCHHVAPGGFILFHDYDSVHWPEVAIAVDEYVSEHMDEIEAYSVHETLFSIELRKK